MEPTDFIWMDGALVPWQDATIHVLSHGLHYGTGVFEGIRAYDTTGGTALFRVHDHMARLHDSAAAYAMPLAYSVEALCDAAAETVQANQLAACYVRPIAFYEMGTIGINPTRARLRVAVITFAWGAYLGEDGVKNGIRVKIASWARISPRAFPSAKATGPYINSVLANQEARQAGYDEALLLAADGHVSEGAGENLFMVADGLVVTPPLSDGCLDGITRRTVMTLLSEDGYEVVERSILPEELAAADELFFTGTAAEVTPIRQVDDAVIGPPGAVTRRAQALFADVTTGRSESHRDWLRYL